MHNLRGIRLAITSGSEPVQNFLRECFIEYSANVVLCGRLNMNFVAQLEDKITADVILVDMDNAYEEDDEAFDALLDRIDLPILFHEKTSVIKADPQQALFSAQEIEKLALKLSELVTPADERLEQMVAKSAEEPMVEQVVEELRAVHDVLQQDKSNNNLTVWVLGASIGGPEAVKRFLATVPAELPVAFVLAQHLGEGFVSLLANQLDHVSHFKVKEALAGDSLKQGEVLIVPVDHRMALDSSGGIEFIDEPWEGYYQPSINTVIDDVCTYYQQHCGVILFSGMGADGVQACQRFSQQHQGVVWAQSAETCVISSMPDSAREAELVSYSGTPEALAVKLTARYMGVTQPLLSEHEHNS